MIAIGIIHIVLLLSAYVGYALTTLKSFSGRTNYLLLTISNILYVVGFVLGMLWAKIDWGFYFSLDIKIVLSALVVLPFLAENLIKTRKWQLPLAGMVLIVANYVVPALLNSIHTH